jgi:hypothetical protein
MSLNRRVFTALGRQVHPRYCPCHSESPPVRAITAERIEMSRAPVGASQLNFNLFPRAGRLIAFHEGAHAVAVIHTGGCLVGSGVRIAGDYVTQTMPMSLSEADFCLIKLSGWVAEGLLLGDPFLSDNHMWDHFRRSREAPYGRCDECLVAACLMLRNPSFDPWDLMDLFRTYTRRTRHFLNFREVWESVERVAYALLAVGHLNDEECRELIDEAVLPSGVRTLPCSSAESILMQR